MRKLGFVLDKLVTDKLRSYGTVAGDLGIAKRHQRGRWHNNRAENSHQPTRRRERKNKASKAWDPRKDYVHAATQNIFNDVA
jgi:putative transposase